MLTERLEDAQFILLPFAFELIYDYTAEELFCKNIFENELHRLKEIKANFDSLSAKSGKKLIVTFYRDPLVKLPFQNALIFRTSGQQTGWENEFGLPAFLEELSNDPVFSPHEKSDKPPISFRGIAAPLKLPLSIKGRLMHNATLGSVWPRTQVTTWYNEGYMLRRKAILSLLKRKNEFQLDLKINPPKWEAEYKQDYQNSFTRYDYFLTTSGHGNYSIRLFETMRAGRIPVFIDTKCLLPCADVINWKDLLIWIDREDASRTAEILLDFHASIHADDFLALQLRIRKTWVDFLSLDGFASYLFYEALPAQLKGS